MATAASALKELKAKGTEKNRITYGRHGHPADRVLGVSVADMKAVARSLKGQQAAAMELFATGLLEPMYVAGIVADGAKMSTAELQAWVEGASDMPMAADYTVPWVTVENAAGPELAMKWIASGDNGITAIGWACYSGLVSTRPDDELDLKEIQALLKKVEKQVHGAENRVRKNMNTFVICVGCYVAPLSEVTRATAVKIGNVSVDVGDTACKVPVALEYIEKVEGMGRVGKKKKTLRC